MKIPQAKIADNKSATGAKNFFEEKLRKNS